MPVRHHPSAQVRADYVAANLPPGAALAVRTHLEFCSVCAIAVQAMDGFPEGPRSNAGARRRIDDRLPHALQSIPLGPWRSIRPKVRAARLQGVSGLGEAVWLVEARRGARLPLTREGSVWAAVVLAGELREGDAEFQAGDFAELEAHPLNDARVESEMVLLLVTDEDWGRPAWRRILENLAPRVG